MPMLQSCTTVPVTSGLSMTTLSSGSRGCVSGSSPEAALDGPPCPLVGGDSGIEAALDGNNDKNKDGSKVILGPQCMTSKMLVYSPADGRTDRQSGPVRFGPI